MDDVWFGPGLTRSDLDRFTGALALRDGRSAVFAVAGAEPRLVLASRALFQLFDVATEATLSARLLAGHDGGAGRLNTLVRTLPLDGAPRLERLRFAIGSRSEVVTVLCRRVSDTNGAPVLVAAALGLRSGPTGVPAPARPEPTADAVNAEGASRHPDAQAIDAAPEPAAAPSTSTEPAAMSVQAIQTMLHTRWPASRTTRFLWQSDADGLCTALTPPLAAVVGPANADLVGCRMGEVAAVLDPSGALAAALESRETWSGLNVAWPITDASAAVDVGLGAIATFDGDKVFGGYRGYGVIHLDRVVTCQPTRLPERADAVATRNVVVFPGGKALSPQDQIAFVALGAELRGQAGLDGADARAGAAQVGPAPHDPVPDDAVPVADAPEESPADETSATAPPAGQAEALDAAGEPLSRAEIADATREVAAIDPDIPVPLPDGSAGERAAEPAPAATPAHAARAAEVGRNGLAVLDRLAVGLLVSRDNIPIFVNRHLLDMLGFAGEDALYEAGGMNHLFGDLPGNTVGGEAVGVRGRDGTVVPANARMQSIEWDGLPATLLTLQQVAAHRADPRDAHDATGGEDGAAVDVARIATAQAHIEDTQARHEEMLARYEALRFEIEAARGRDEDELRELRAILETSADGVAVIDAHGDVVSLNRSGEALFGCERGAAVGRPFTALFAPHDQGLAQGYFDELRSNARKSLLNDGCEFVVEAHQGTIPVFMTLGRLGSATDPEAARFCALFRDLTHWKKVERELDGARQDAERASALKTDFLSRVSREVRAPLNTIVGLADAVAEERFGPLGDKRYKDYLREIHAASRHVIGLVADLLDLSKIEAGQMDLAADTLDANRIVGDCVATMQAEASRARVIMRLSLAPTLPQIKADGRSLRQIVLNLLSNAVRFNEPGGQVIVATAATDGQVLIRIRDTGPGMSEAAIKAALEPFGHPTAGRLADAAPATGLGLPLTKALVEANGAAFTIRSKIDHGTLVEVAFPKARVSAG